MIILEFTKSALVEKGSLLYEAEDGMLNTANRVKHGFASLLVNDLNLEFDEKGSIFSIWGYLPSVLWERSDIPPPDSIRGTLKVNIDTPPGTAKRITPLGDFWPVLYDEKSGWISIFPRHKKQIDSSVEFIAGGIVALSNGEIVGLWLQPEMG